MSRLIEFSGRCIVGVILPAKGTWRKSRSNPEKLVYNEIPKNVKEIYWNSDTGKLELFYQNMNDLVLLNTTVSRLGNLLEKVVLIGEVKVKIHYFFIQNNRVDSGQGRLIQLWSFDSDLMKKLIIKLRGKLLSGKGR